MSLSSPASLTSAEVEPLPTDLALPENFSLSEKEQREVRILAARLASADPFKFCGLASTSTNIGVQYLLLKSEDPEILESLMTNKTLHPEIFPYIIEIADPVSFAKVALLANTQVISDVKLFKLVLDSIHGNDIPTLTNNLYEMLYIHSVADRGGTYSMGIETLLVTLTYIARNFEHSKPLSKLSALILDTRGEEIRGWVESNLPDFVDLPLTWFLKVADLYV